MRKFCNVDKLGQFHNFLLGYIALTLRTFGVHFRHIENENKVQFCDAQVCPR